MFGFGGTSDKEGDRSLSGVSAGVGASASGNASFSASTAARSSAGTGVGANANASFNGANRASATSKAGVGVSASRSAASGSGASIGGREGTGGGPGGPAGTGRASGTGAGSDTGRFGGGTSNPSNPSRTAGDMGSGSRIGSGGFGTAANYAGAMGREGDRSLSTGMDPTRFGARNTMPTGFDTSRFGGDLAATKGDRVTRTGFDPATDFAEDRAAQERRASLDRVGQPVSSAMSDQMRNEIAAQARGFGTPTAAGDYEAHRAQQVQARADMERGVAKNASEAASMKSMDTMRATDLAEQKRTSEDKSMTDLSWENALAQIRGPEAGKKDPYNTIFGGSTVNLTGMTIADVMAYQAEMKRTGKKSTAVGAYQIMGYTLPGIVNELGISKDTLFDEETQDYIAKGLIQRRYESAKAKDGSVNPTDFANQISKEWASFKNSSGVGDYDNDGLNKASVGFDKTLGMAKDLQKYGAVTSSDRFASNYLGTPDTSVQKAPIGGSDPATIGATGYDPAKNPANARAAAMFGDPPEQGDQETQIGPPNGDLSKFPDKPYTRSGFGEVAAMGIDALGSMIPGVGVGVSVANAGLALTGNRTIGQRVVDSIAQGDNNYTPGQTSGHGERGFSVTNAALPKATPVKKPGTTTATAPFADKYLDGWKDDGIKRPTPAEKWDTRIETYGGREYGG